MQRHLVHRVDGGIITNDAIKNVIWRRGRNVRFKPGVAYKSKGKSLITTVPGALSIRAQFSFVGHDGILRTVVCCDNKIFAYQDHFAAIQDITPAPVPTGTSYNWQFSLIGGMLEMTNGINGVWKWPDYGATLTSLANAPARTKLLATVDNRPLFGNIREGSINHRARLSWGGIFKPETRTVDRTMQADYQDLIDRKGQSDAIEIPLAFSPRAGRHLVYTKRNIWGMSPVAPPAHYALLPIYPIGLAAARAKVTDKTGVDWIMGVDDFYFVADGAPVPIGLNIRNACFDKLNRAAIHTAFAFEQPETREIFFCVALGTSTEPDTAFVYHRELKAWTILDCNYLCANNSRQGTDDTEDLFPYMVVGNAAGQILRLDHTDTDNGEAFTGYLEGGDYNAGSSLLEKQVHSIIPNISETASIEPLMVQVGVKRSMDSPATFSYPSPFSFGISKEARAVKKGEWFFPRFYTDQPDSPWELTGYELLYDNLSRR